MPKLSQCSGSSPRVSIPSDRIRQLLGNDHAEWVRRPCDYDVIPLLHTSNEQGPRQTRYSAPTWLDGWLRHGVSAPSEY